MKKTIALSCLFVGLNLTSFALLCNSTLTANNEKKTTLPNKEKLEKTRKKYADIKKRYESREKELQDNTPEKEKTSEAYLASVAAIQKMAYDEYRDTKRKEWSCWPCHCFGSKIRNRTNFCIMVLARSDYSLKR